MCLQRDRKDFSTFLFNIHKSNAFFIYIRKNVPLLRGSKTGGPRRDENASFPVRAACLLCRGFLKVTGFAKGLCLRVRSRCFVSHPAMASRFTERHVLAHCPLYRPFGGAFPAPAPHCFRHCAAKSRTYLCELRKVEKMY